MIRAPSLPGFGFRVSGKGPQKLLRLVVQCAECFSVTTAADTKVTVVRGSGTLVASVVGRTSIGELTANCEHGDEIDRGEFDIGPAGKAIRWRVLFCDPCWEHFRHHQEVIDLHYFESSPAEPATERKA